jgi:hypothetical protein
MPRISQPKHVVIPRGVLTSLVAVMLCCASALVGASSALASPGTTQTTFTASETIPVPPASNYSGSAGGDGWGVALSQDSVYNVVHHQSSMQVACHLQSDGSPCWSPETVTDAQGNNFATSGHPGMYLDQSSGKLYVYGTRTSDNTAGVVCFDTTQAATNPNPFCGFTTLTGAGEASTAPGWGQLSAPMQVGSRLYAFNYDAPPASSPGVETVAAGETITSVSCASGSQCTVVDTDGDEVTFDPTTGQVNAAGAVAVAPDGTYLASVSCASVTQCTAVDNGGNEVTFDPTSGTVNAAGITTVDGGQSSGSVSCASVSQCTAVDSGGNEVTFDPTSGTVSTAGVTELDDGQQLTSV